MKKEIWRFNLKWQDHLHYCDKCPNANWKYYDFWDYWEAVCNYKSLEKAFYEIKKAGDPASDSFIATSLICGLIFQAWEDKYRKRNYQESAYFNNQRFDRKKIEKFIKSIGGYKIFGRRVDRWEKLLTKVIYPKLKHELHDLHYKKLKAWLERQNENLCRGK